MKPLYEAQATAIGGRTGIAATADGRLSVGFSMPKEVGGAGGDGVNPEQLFALGYAACFLTAIKNVAGQRKIEITSDSNVTATVGVGPREKDAEALVLTIALTIDLPGLDRETATSLVAHAHENCPYSNATRGNVAVKLHIA
jgi:lipoyl-dependent peroxiredoxin